MWKMKMLIILLSIDWLVGWFINYKFKASQSVNYNKLTEMFKNEELDIDKVIDRLH
jgi:hypothetical protein